MSDFVSKPYIDRDGTEWQMVRCAGCGVPAGYTGEDGLRRAFYCSAWCVWEHEVRENPAQRVSRLSTNEARNDAWYWLYQAGRQVSYIAKLYGIENDMRIHKSIRTRVRDDERRVEDRKKRKIATVTKIRR